MNNIVDSKRIIYTASEFAKNTLLHVQEIGKSTSLKKHTSSRNYLQSFLFFIVTDGFGVLNYENNKYKLSKGSVVFINCNNSYSHTSDNWTIKWIHFNGPNIESIYSKYLSRGGKPTYSSSSFDKYNLLIDSVFDDVSSNEFTADMNINSRLSELLAQIMLETVYQSSTSKKHIYNINEIKNYIDDNYLSNISLEKLSEVFYINKFYLTRLFKDSYSKTINEYISYKRIAKAKELLRFSNKTIEQIAVECNIPDSNYFSRVFKKIEGISPIKYRQLW